MIVDPKVSYYKPDGTPVFSIRKEVKSDLLWWGVNLSTMGASITDVRNQLEMHDPEMPVEEADDVWLGYVDARFYIQEWKRAAPQFVNLQTLALVCHERGTMCTAQDHPVR